MSESGFSGLKDFQDNGPDALVHLAPAGRHVYRQWHPSDLKPQRGDMCSVSESLIKQMTQIARIIVRIRILKMKGFSGWCMSTASINPVNLYSDRMWHWFWRIGYNSTIKKTGKGKVSNQMNAPATKPGVSIPEKGVEKQYA